MYKNDEERDEAAEAYRTTFRGSRFAGRHPSQPTDATTVPSGPRDTAEPNTPGTDASNDMSEGGRSFKTYAALATGAAVLAGAAGLAYAHSNGYDIPGKVYMNRLCQYSGLGGGGGDGSALSSEAGSSVEAGESWGSALSSAKDTVAGTVGEWWSALSEGVGSWAAGAGTGGGGTEGQSDVTDSPAERAVLVETIVQEMQEMKQ